VKEVLHGLYGNSTAILHNDLVHFGIAGEVKVVINSTSGVNVGVSAIAASTSLCTESVMLFAMTY
jgi:hypothetical protein